MRAVPPFDVSNGTREAVLAARNRGDVSSPIRCFSHNRPAKTGGTPSDHGHS